MEKLEERVGNIVRREVINYDEKIKIQITVFIILMFKKVYEIVIFRL